VLVSEASIEIPESARLPPPALLRSCRQLCNEATSIYYAENTFHATIEETLKGPLIWLTCTRYTSRILIRSLTLEYKVSKKLHTLHYKFAKALLGQSPVSSVRKAQVSRTAGVDEMHRLARKALTWVVLLGTKSEALRFEGPALLEEDEFARRMGGSVEDVVRGMEDDVRSIWVMSLERQREALQRPEHREGMEKARKEREWIMQ